MIQNVKRGYVTDRALRISWDKAVAELNSFAAMFGLAKDLFPTADARVLDDPPAVANFVCYDCGSDFQTSAA